jgi:hypothetical protein
MLAQLSHYVQNLKCFREVEQHELSETAQKGAIIGSQALFLFVRQF